MFEADVEAGVVEAGIIVWKHNGNGLLRILDPRSWKGHEYLYAFTNGNLIFERDWCHFVSNRLFMQVIFSSIYSLL